MRPEDYPAQEPFTSIGGRYHEEVMNRAPSSDGYEVQHGECPYQSLSVFPADKACGDVLCVMHGGGWTNGYKEWMSFMAPALNALGVTLVTLGYRLAPQHLFPQGFEDCLDGIAWTHANITDCGGSPQRIFVGGHSAGGHYAALAALREDWQASRALPANVVRGALPISATYYFGEASGLSMKPRFLGTDPDVERDASPIEFVHPKAPPFLLTHGEADFPHLVRQAAEFETKLCEKGVMVSTMTLAGCDHLGASYASGEMAGQWPTGATEFMRRIG